jgi:hypothetical protein
MHDFIQDIETVLAKDKHHLTKLDDIHLLNAYFTKRLRDFTATGGRLQHLKFEGADKETMVERAQMYRQILHHEAKEEEDSLQQLKSSIKTALQTYITGTFTLRNIKKGDRAASEKRISNIKNIFTTVENATDSNELIAALEKELKNIRSGFGFKFGMFSIDFGKSDLRKLMLKEIEAYKNKPQEFPHADETRPSNHSN